VSPPTIEQQRRRERFEALIALAAPALDLVLAVGDRVSRLPGGDDYIPIRPAGERLELGSYPRREVPSGRQAGRSSA
jgi:hypothetical protein